nr:MAG TPA: hypothetical protein [Bacteriophage sp.]DAS21408.1 MAG TPA: hypothetical protein [Caudoviricetes sp.]
MQYIAQWCNGNTTAFDAVIVGSSPACAARGRIATG